MDKFNNFLEDNLTAAEAVKKIELTEKCKKNFQELNKRLTSAPILTIPVAELGNVAIYCDAFKMGLGAILMQNGKVIVCDAFKGR